MTNVDSFYDDCLGCGLKYDNGKLVPALSPSWFECGPNGIRLIQDIVATDNNIRGNAACSSPNPADCKADLRWDCSTGELYADPGPCQSPETLRDSDAIFETITGVLGTDIITLTFPDDNCSDCRADIGYRTVIFGQVTIRNEIDNFSNDFALSAWQSDAEVTLTNGSGNLAVCYDLQADAWFGNEIRYRSHVFNFPINYISDDCGTLTMTLKGGSNTSFADSPSVTVDISAYYDFHLTRLLVPIC